MHYHVVSGFQPCRLALIRIEVQLQPTIRRYAHENIAKQYSMRVAFSAYVNAIPIDESEAISIEGAHVQMAQRTDYTVFKSHLRSGALEENARGLFKIAGCACRSLDSERARIRLRQLYLVGFPRRPNDADFG